MPLKARLSANRLTVRCGRRGCQGAFGEVYSSGDIRYFTFDPGWTEDDAGVWRLGQHNRKRWQRGYRPRHRRPMPIGHGLTRRGKGDTRGRHPETITFSFPARMECPDPQCGFINELEAPTLDVAPRPLFEVWDVD